MSMEYMEARMQDRYDAYEDAAAGWRPIETYHSADGFVKVKQVLCAHSEKKWIRFGRYYPEMKHWYYSGTNERSQWSQVQGDAPTHWMPLPMPPGTAADGSTDA